MKFCKLNPLPSFLLLFFLSVTVIWACSEEKKIEAISFDTELLKSLVSEAENLVKNSDEGMQPGLYMPGSVEELQKGLTEAQTILNNPESEENVSNAVKSLKEAIDLFKTKKLRAAIPYIKQRAGTYIKISDGIKYTIRGSFTIETDCYFMDLNPLGYSNTVFSCAQMEPNSGFGVRYFEDGHIEIVVGNGDWKDAKSVPGVVKVGQWQKFSLTSTGTIHKLYVDGVEAVSLEQEHLAAKDAALVIGNGYVFNDRVVNAMVKDVRVWNTVRTESEVIENKDVMLNGNESGLIAYFPLNVDLGKEFYDLTNSFKAELVGSIELVYDGGKPEIVLDYSKLDKAISSAENMKNNIVEGSGDGDYPNGTKDFIQKLIDGGKAAKSDAKWQKDVDKETKNIEDALEIVEGTNVAPTLAPAGTYSAIFGGGNFYSGDAAILDMKHSGFTTAILWTIHIEDDGSMIFNDKGVIDQNGDYIGDPEWGARLATLLEAPTTVDRIELGIGAWGSKSWENIKKLIDQEGIGSDTKLYKAIKKLKEVTGATAINYDDELTYDVESTVAFSLMLDDLGLKVSLCPYTKSSYWKSVYEQVESERPGTIDRVYLQCYAGGASNNPINWNQHFGEIKVSKGLWCKHGSACNEGDSPAEIENDIRAEKTNISGGFIWLYDDIRKCSDLGNTQDYASAINKGLE